MVPKMSYKYFKSKNISKWNKINIPIDRSSPIFLIGFPRSGTTLLDTIFRSHPSIEVVEEKPMVEIMRRELNSLNVKLDKIDKKLQSKLSDLYFSELSKYIEIKNAKNKIIIDRYPLNIIEMRLIHIIFFYF